jgi:hypothetical protein
MDSDCYIPYHKVATNEFVYEKSSGRLLELRPIPGQSSCIFRPYGVEIPTREYLNSVRASLSRDEYQHWINLLKPVEEWILVFGEPV